MSAEAEDLRKKLQERWEKVVDSFKERIEFGGKIINLQKELIEKQRMHISSLKQLLWVSWAFFLFIALVNVLAIYYVR